MIPYEDLVAALTYWRERNGLPTGAADYLGEPPPPPPVSFEQYETPTGPAAEQNADSEMIDESMVEHEVDHEVEQALEQFTESDYDEHYAQAEAQSEYAEEYAQAEYAEQPEYAEQADYQAEGHVYDPAPSTEEYDPQEIADYAEAPQGEYDVDEHMFVASDEETTNVAEGIPDESLDAQAILDGTDDVWGSAGDQDAFAEVPLAEPQADPEKPEE